MNIVFKKGNAQNISKHFRYKDFECKCALPTCVDQIISKELISKLEAAREAYNKPIVITSGYRCEEHNKNIGGSPKSQHMSGQACDCKPLNFSDVELKQLTEELKKLFDSIGISPHFTHVDTRKDKKRNWTY